MLQHKSSLFPGPAQLLVTFGMDPKSAKWGLGMRRTLWLNYGIYSFKNRQLE